MKGRLFLVDWNEASAQACASRLRSEGWEVEVEAEDGGRAYKRMKETPPDVVIINLSRKPSHGREVGKSLRELKATRTLPIVFVDGEEQANQLAREKVGDDIFTTSSNLKKALARLST